MAAHTNIVPHILSPVLTTSEATDEVPTAMTNSSFGSMLVVLLVCLIVLRPGQSRWRAERDFAL